MKKTTSTAPVQEQHCVHVCPQTVEHTAERLSDTLKNFFAGQHSKRILTCALGVTVAIVTLSVADVAAKPYHNEDAVRKNLIAGVETTAPIGYRQMCTEQPSMCPETTGKGQKLRLNDAMLHQINMVNLEINTTVKPVTDMDLYGVMEKWTLPTNGAGDCEDYVLLKRKILMEKGVSEDALLITVVRDLKGEGHAVLTVVTDQGDLILDNHNNTVKLWHETGYTFIKRQSQDNATHWVSLRGNDLPTVASTSTRK